MCSFKAMGHCLRECYLPEHFMTLSVKPISSRDEAERTTHLYIKAINKIIGLVILFQTSRLLAHPAAVKDHFLTVTGDDCCIPSSGPEGALWVCATDQRDAETR